MAVISKDGYAIAIKKSPGVFRIVKAHKKFARAKETLHKFIEHEPDSGYVMVKELHGSVYEVYYPFDLPEE